MIKVELARRLKELPPYLFAQIDRMKEEALARGADLIDLSIGDPDLPTPGHIVQAMKQAVERPENHRYPSYQGMPRFREAVARWYKRRFGVSLDAATEVLSLIGSKEGIGHISLAFAQEGDVVLYCSPGYPVYSIGALFAGARPVALPLRQERHFFPDLEAVPQELARRAKLLFLNYPNNPTAQTATLEFFQQVVAFAERHNVIVCHDAAYSELYFDEQRPLSFLQTPGGKGVGVEFHSLSKTYNMTGWRVGFCVGNAQVVAGLGRIKTNLDSGVFQAIQEAAIAALETPEESLASLRRTYQERRDVLLQGLAQSPLRAFRPKATFYVWARCPEGWDSTGLVQHLLKEAAVLATPGVGFGPEGEGYVRFALCAPKERIKEAAERIQRALR